MENSDGKERCTLCGKECDKLTIVDDETRVCPECLDMNYERCEGCGEYWDIGAIEVTEAPDGRMLCEYCMEELEEESEEDEEEDEEDDEEGEEGDEEEEETCSCDRCGKKFDESELTELDDEKLCEKCLEQAKIEALDDDGIWFSAGGWNEVTYEIRGDDACCSAAFEDFDADEAFELWRTHCVNLESELNEAFYFFMKKGTLRKGPVYCYFKEDVPFDLAEELDITEEEAEGMDDGNPPKGWVCVDAKKAMKFINFAYAGM